jgi:3-deoxy-manno-octulosonate cytidylyltransferase (CMP-KDO synthetase)
MYENSIACVIPARLDSGRFPGKLLYLLDGIPVIQHTFYRAKNAECFDEIFCFTDSKEIKRTLNCTGCEVILTGPANNGTERIALNMDYTRSGLIVNLQGDEPLFPLAELQKFATELKAEPESVHILAYRSDDTSEYLNNPDRVKVILDSSGYAVDFKRELDRNVLEKEGLDFAVQMGIYGYSKKFLAQYAELSPSKRENHEAHELLRDLSLCPVKVHQAGEFSHALDVPGDLQEIHIALKREKGKNQCDRTNF